MNVEKDFYLRSLWFFNFKVWNWCRKVPFSILFQFHFSSVPIPLSICFSSIFFLFLKFKNFIFHLFHIDNRFNSTFQSFHIAIPCLITYDHRKEVVDGLVLKCNKSFNSKSPQSHRPYSCHVFLPSSLLVLFV